MNQPQVQMSTIMIVDDEAENREALIQMLAQFGFELQVAHHGQEMFELLDNTLPDIILLDVLMPGMDGFEVCRRLKEKNDTKDIPVILMTALSETVNKVTGLELGAVDYITKPFQEEEVLGRLKSNLVIRSLQKQIKQTNESLDYEVTQRTRELAESNERLQQEIAEHRRMEKILKQAQKMEAIGTLSSGIAHDFNNILSIIIGYSEMAGLYDLPKESEVEVCLKSINEAAFRAKDLVQQILTFCR